MILSLISTLLILNTTIKATTIMQYPNALNRTLLQSLPSPPTENKKIMTIFKSNLYSLNTIKTILQQYDPNLSIITNKQTSKIIILHNKNQHQKLTSMLSQLNLLPIKIQINCYIYEINNEFENELNLINSPLEQGTQFNYQNISAITDKLALLDTIKTLEKKGHATLIAQPQFKIENGKSASLIIGEKLPYVTTIINPTSTTQSLQHVQTGLDITISGTIISENQIQSNIHCNLSNVKLWKSMNDNSYPILGSRHINIDTILTNNKPTLITQFTDSISKTYQSHNPLVKKIPFLRHLTGLKTKKTTQTKLCIILKPTIQRN
tara:strand:+ start:5091 stop:6056 length:966 start_codon:yes stop_codon:yes gene_type:complete